MASIKAGAALPVKVQTTTNIKPGPALLVYGYKSAPADRPAAGGAAMPVKVLSASDLKQNGGAFDLAGDVQAIAVYTSTDSHVQGGPAIPVYVLNPTQWP